MTDLATRTDREPKAMTTQELLLFVAGFACGLALHQVSTLRRSREYIFSPAGTVEFRSLLGSEAIGLVWAVPCGLAALVVARGFRDRERPRPAGWLAVSLAVVLFGSAVPGFRPELPTDWTEVQVLVGRFGKSSPHQFTIIRPQPADSRGELAQATILLTATAVVLGISWRGLRSRVSQGWGVVLTIAIAVLLTLGPIRQLEAMFPEVSRCWQGAVTPGRLPGQPWSAAGLALYLEVRTWIVYSIRALCLVIIAGLAAVSLARRSGRGRWTEWAALASALVLACTWAYDEFAARPALDWGARVTVLGVWLSVLGLLALALIRTGASVSHRDTNRPDHGPSVA